MNSDRPVPIFTAEQIDVLHAAFATVCGKLGLKAGDRATEDVAVRIVDLAATGICDIEGLTTATLSAFRPSAKQQGRISTADDSSNCAPDANAKASERYV
jgi:hypothetical protein